MSAATMNKRVYNIVYIRKEASFGKSLLLFIAGAIVLGGPCGSVQNRRTILVLHHRARTSVCNNGSISPQSFAAHFTLLRHNPPCSLYPPPAALATRFLDRRQNKPNRRTDRCPPHRGGCRGECRDRGSKNATEWLSKKLLLTRVNITAEGGGDPDAPRA